jgi:hypothetical protein
MAPPLFIVVSRHSRDGAVAPRREVAFLSGSHVYVWADGVYLQARMKGAERNDYVISSAECMLVLIGACASSARFPAPRSGGRRAVGQASGCLTVSGTRTIRGTVTYAGRERYGITAHENRKCARRCAHGNCKRRACRLDATSVRCRQKRAGSTKSAGWMSTAGDSKAGLLRIRSAFDAPFQFTVRRDERSAIGASPPSGQASQPKPFEFAISDKCAKASAVS